MGVTFAEQAHEQVWKAESTQAEQSNYACVGFLQLEVRADSVEQALVHIQTFAERLQGLYMCGDYVTRRLCIMRPHCCIVALPRVRLSQSSCGLKVKQAVRQRVARERLARLMSPSRGGVKCRERGAVARPRNAPCGYLTAVAKEVKARLSTWREAL